MFLTFLDVCNSQNARMSEKHAQSYLMDEGLMGICSNEAINTWHSMDIVFQLYISTGDPMTVVTGIVAV